MPTPSELVQQLWIAIDRQVLEQVEPLIHPDATLEMAMASTNPVEGREAIMAVLREAWQRVHSLSASEIHQVGADAVVVTGRSRYPLPNGGFGDSQFAWLCEWRDGMLWRQRLYSSAEEARDVAERQGRAGAQSSP